MQQPLPYKTILPSEFIDTIDGSVSTVKAARDGTYRLECFDFSITTININHGTTAVN
jgi:hypothetical protein